MKAKTIITLLAVLAFGTVSAEEGVQWERLNDDQKKVLSIYSEGWEQLDPQQQKRHPHGTGLRRTLVWSLRTGLGRGCLGWRSGTPHGDLDCCWGLLTLLHKEQST